MSTDSAAILMVICAVAVNVAAAVACSLTFLCSYCKATH